MSKGAKIASAALNTVLTGLAIFAVSEVLNIIINYEKDLAKKIQDATNAYKQRVETLDSYKQSIKSLYDTINSDSTSFEDHVEANRQLLEIQQELIKNYDPEVSGINFVTDSIEEQTKAIEALENAKNSAYAMQDWENQANQYEQWQKIVSGIVTVGSYYDMLMNPMTIPEMQNFLGEKGYVSPDQIFDRPLDELVNKYTNFTKEISATTNRELNKIIASYDNIIQEGNKFIISGNVDEVQKTILGIQHSLKNYSGYTQQWEDELINVYNTASEISKQFGDGYNQYLEKQILEEEEFVLEQQKLADAYNKYLEAITSGDNAKILVAIDEYKNAVNTILKDGWMSDDLQQYIIGKYAGPVSSSYVELENQFNELKELRDKYQDEIGEDPLLINKRRYSGIKDTYGSTVTAVTREMQLGAKEISEVSKQYDEAISTDAGQLYKLIGEQGLTAVDLLTTTDEKIQQLLARLAAQYTDGDIRALINLLVQLDQVSDGTRENAAKKVLSNFQVTDARDRQQYSELEQEYIKLFESEGKEFTDWVNNELEVPDDVIYSVQELRDKWTEVLIARQKAAKVDDLNVNSTIAESVSNYSDRIKPWIDQLDDLYLSLKQEDGTFDLSKITNEDFQGIIDQFRAVSEATGIAFDEKDLETFLYTLSDIEQKGGDVQEAFDRYATSLFNDVARLDGRLKDLNHNNANTFKQMLSQDGIENANEVVEYYLLLQDAGIELDKHIQTLTDNSVRAANARTVAAQEEAKAVTKSTYDEIAAMIQEKGATEELHDALYSLSAQELIRSGEIDINTSGGVQQLLNLAGAAGVTEKMLKALYALINAQGALDRAMSAGIEGKAYDKMDNAVQVAQERLNALMNQSLEMDLEIHPVAPDTDKGGAGDAGKEEADAYLEAFNAELENLDWLHENGKISIAVYYSNVV